MACYCGACGVQIGSSAENGGPFSTNLKPSVDDTCEGCEKALKEVLTKAVLDIRERVKQDAKYYAERAARLTDMEKKR